MGPDFYSLGKMYRALIMCQAVEEAQEHSREQALLPGCRHCAPPHPAEGLEPENSACSCGEAEGKAVTATGQKTWMRHEPLQEQGFYSDFWMANKTALLSHPAALEVLGSGTSCKAWQPTDVYPESLVLAQRKKNH